MLLLLQTLFSPGSSRFHEVCAENYYIGGWKYSRLFSKLEGALLNNKTVMNLLRQMFMRTENVEIGFSVQLELVNGTDLSSSCDINPDFINDTFYTLSSFDTFCPSNSSDYKWKLYNIPEKYGFDSLEMIYRSPHFSEVESEREKCWIDVAIAWLSLLHGNILSMFYFVPDVVPDPDFCDYYDGSDYLYDDTSVSMTLVMERLDCNPSLPMTQCALSEILSWVSKLLTDKGVS